MFGLTDPEVHQVLQALLKMGIGVTLAGLVGLEREMHARPAGIRTHMLLILGVIIFCEASTHFGGDPARIAAQVVTGVGFLGAGTIMRTGGEITGLTTAASLWATASVGMAVSMGGPFMAIAVAAVGLSLATLVWVDKIESRFLRKNYARILRLTLNEEQGGFEVLAELGQKHGIKVHSVDIVQKHPDVIVDIGLHGNTDGLVEKLISLKSVVGASWK